MRMRPRGPASPLSRSAVRRPGNVGEMLSHQPARRRQSWLLAWRQRDDGDTTAFAFYHGQTGMQDEAKQTVSAETKTEITLTVHLIKGLLEIEWAILGGQSGGSMQERTLRRRYSSSFSP